MKVLSRAKDKEIERSKLQSTPRSKPLDRKGSALLWIPYQIPGFASQWDDPERTTAWPLTSPPEIRPEGFSGMLLMTTG